MRTLFSYDVTGKLAGAVAHSIGLRSVGAVAGVSPRLSKRGRSLVLDLERRSATGHRVNHRVVMPFRGCLLACAMFAGAGALRVPARLLAVSQAARAASLCHMRTWLLIGPTDELLHWKGGFAKQLALSPCELVFSKRVKEATLRYHRNTP